MDFQKDVIERSNEVPVVVDFWAPWCGPCQFLGPVIEELAAEAQGRWELVKVNTDENPQVSAQYGIRGIPAVKMFSKGEVIAEFTGALPKPQIQKWLSEHIPDERKAELEEIRKKLQKDKNAISELRDFVQQNPDLREGKILLARNLAFEDTDKAYKLVAELKPGQPDYDVAVNIQTLSEVQSCEVPGDGEASEKFKEVKEQLKNHQLEDAVSNLIDIVMINKSFCNDLPRLATIAIFNLLGPENEITRKYRRKFDMALY